MWYNLQIDKLTTVKFPLIEIRYLEYLISSLTGKREEREDEKKTDAILIRKKKNRMPI